MGNNLTRKSKYLSRLLRHDSEDLIIHDNGFILVDDILSKLDISFDDLKILVETCLKQRFEFNDTKELIRARQGHSNDKVKDVGLEILSNLDIEIYHGTSESLIPSIMEKGINKMSRHHVHWGNKESAIKRSKTTARNNNSNPVLIKLDVQNFLDSGGVILRSRNNVYLTDDIPSSFLSIINM